MSCQEKRHLSPEAEAFMRQRLEAFQYDLDHPRELLEGPSERDRMSGLGKLNRSTGRVAILTEILQKFGSHESQARARAVVADPTGAIAQEYGAETLAQAVSS